MSETLAALLALGLLDQLQAAEDAVERVREMHRDEGSKEAS